ncbi:hypothetical protein KSS87_020890 [Heliosperma pusillum]|nr:hypothetical protein KSS87_020890 [Heliosperma pusillum]
MNASRFMDKQIMDLSRSSMADNNNNNSDFIDLMNPQVDQHRHQVEINDGLLMNKKKSEILPNYDFHPVNSVASSTVTRDWSSLDDSNLPNLSANRSYGSPNHVQLDKKVPEKAQVKAQKVDDSAILSEIDRTMKKHTETLMHAIDSLSARLSQMESRTRQLEHSMDELKVSVGNAHGSADGKLRQLENIIMEVQTGVQNVKDKQDVIEGHMLLAKLQISKSEQSSKPANSVHQDSAQQAAAAAASAPPQQSGFPQLATSPQSYASLAPPNAPPPSQQNNHPPGPHRDAYFPTHDSSSQQYQIPPPVQNQQPGPPAPQPQPQQPQPQPHQYQPSPTPPYPQPPHPPQQHPSIVGNSGPQYQPSSASMGHRSDESPYVPTQTYPSNLYQPTAQPSGGPPPMQSYYGNTSPMYEQPPPPARSSSSFPSSYAPPSGPSEPFPYGGPTSHYGGGPPVKPQPHSPRGGAGGYPQLPTARVLPSAIPTASGVGGGSSSGGGGNKVPIDDVVDKVTNMGFSRDQVRATVRRLTDNGQSVDLNIVLDKLMNDADVQQPPKGWFGR